ncbi:phosphatase PAP2 family protein [Deinococcus ruber]|uniref:Phosphatidylglycerophosphatase B n=1 Tax=Deinococcus ruber TaxID=1848197 RepID=A0A918FFS6_9DEIO|nr:phosphatase PAP2 family protein [Deinococcus ruber]GGR35250.1 phosphatidylglycerophosphatase B [Deinococcus ruber]
MPQFQKFAARHHSSLTLLLGVLLPLFIFVRLSRELEEDGGFSADAPLLLFLHRWATPRTDRAVVRLTATAGVKVMPLLALAVSLGLWRARRPRQAAFFFLSVAGSAAIMELVKRGVQRARPALWVSPAPERDTSFPSGHSMASSSFALASSLLLWPTRWRLPAAGIGFVYAVLIGASRVYLGVHYPSDVLAAWTAAIAWTAGLYRLMFRKPSGTRPTAAPRERAALSTVSTSLFTRSSAAVLASVLKGSARRS